MLKILISNRSIMPSRVSDWIEIWIKLISLLHWSSKSCGRNSKSCWSSPVESGDWRPDVANLLRGASFRKSGISLFLLSALSPHQVLVPHLWWVLCGFCGGAASRAMWAKTVTRCPASESWPHAPQIPRAPRNEEEAVTFLMYTRAHILGVIKRTRKKGEVKAKKETTAEGCEMETDKLSNWIF